MACAIVGKGDSRLETPLKFSVVIANYNYDRFVCRAIDSALGMHWRSVEVIVVDDGSRDNSRDVIAGYGDKITAIFQENTGQLGANNAGFAVATGDVIIFLDADDVLLPEIAVEIAAVWHDGISKVQVLMQRVDEQEQPLRSILPRLAAPPSADQIRRWASTTSEYPTPPGSGNAYARTFLEKLFPLGKDRDSFTDSTCVAMAPFMGDVVTIVRPLVLYRMHGANDSNLLANEANFGREVARAMKRQVAAQDACGMSGLPPLDDGALRRGTHLLQLRAASLRLRPAEHPLVSDNRLAALADALLLPFRAGFEPLSRRVMMAAYTVIILTLPKPMARTMIRKRFGTR